MLRTYVFSPLEQFEFVLYNFFEIYQVIVASFKVLNFFDSSVLSTDFISEGEFDMKVEQNTSFSIAAARLTSEQNIFLASELENLKIALSGQKNMSLLNKNISLSGTVLKALDKSVEQVNVSVFDTFNPKFYSIAALLGPVQHPSLYFADHVYNGYVLTDFFYRPYSAIFSVDPEFKPASLFEHVQEVLRAYHNSGATEQNVKELVEFFADPEDPRIEDFYIENELFMRQFIQTNYSVLKEFFLGISTDKDSKISFKGDYYVEPDEILVNASTYMIRNDMIFQDMLTNFSIKDVLLGDGRTVSQERSISKQRLYYLLSRQIMLNQFFPNWTILFLPVLLNLVRMNHYFFIQYSLSREDYLIDNIKRFLDIYDEHAPIAVTDASQLQANLQTIFYDYAMLSDISNLMTSFYFYINSFNFMIFLVLFLLFFAVFISRFVSYSVVSSFEQLWENVYSFVESLVEQQVGLKGFSYFPIFFSIFIFVVGLNVIGMLPFSFTVTGQLLFTFFFGLSLNLGFFFLGFYLHGLHFLKFFVPSGVPSALLPLIVVIEVFSYSIRTFSLSIRLFVNMMAGHCLLFVVSSFVFGILATNYFFIVLIIFIYLALFILELAIAFLQAYVFTILGVIYLGDAIKGGEGH